MDVTESCKSEKQAPTQGGPWQNSSTSLQTLQEDTPDLELALAVVARSVTACWCSPRVALTDTNGVFRLVSPGERWPAKGATEASCWDHCEPQNVLCALMVRLKLHAKPSQLGSQSQGTGHGRRQQLLCVSRAVRKRLCSPISSCSADVLRPSRGPRTQPAACPAPAALPRGWH